MEKFLLIFAVYWASYFLTSAHTPDEVTNQKVINFQTPSDIDYKEGKHTRTKRKSKPEVQIYSKNVKNEDDDEDDFVNEDRSLFETKSIDAIAEQRKLLVDDGVNEDQVLQELPGRQPKSSRNFGGFVGGRSALAWRLKDVSILDQLSQDILSTQDYQERLETLVGGGDSESIRTMADLYGRPSNVYEVAVQPPTYTNNGTGECIQANNECDSYRKTISLRQRLQQDLDTSYSEPLSSHIDYRLKKKPSIYMSKRPHTRLDIGIPDIYEMEVEVTPVNKPHLPPSALKRKSSFDSHSEELHPNLDKSHHKKFVSFSSSPKFVSLGSLSNSRNGSVGTPQRDLAASNKRKKPNGTLRRNALQRGSTRAKMNPRGGGIKKHLPFRRPVSFKFKRNGSDKLNGYSLDHDAKNKTKELSSLEKIAHNKTPGIVIERPNISKHNIKGILSPYSGRDPMRRRRPFRFRPGKRRQKKRGKQSSKPEIFLPKKTQKEDSNDSERTPATGYQLPTVNLQTPTNEYLPPESFKPKNLKTDIDSPISSTYLVPNDKEKAAPGYEEETKGNVYPNKESNTYSVPEDKYSDSEKVTEIPKNYLLPDSPSNTFQKPSKHYELPSNEYLAPRKEISKGYNPQLPAVNYNPPTEKHILTPSKPDPRTNGVPVRTKGQIPIWLMNLKNSKINPTPSPGYFPETSTKWTPVKPVHDIGPMFIMPKHKYTLPHTIAHIKTKTDYGPPPTSIHPSNRDYYSSKNNNDSYNPLPLPLRKYQPPKNDYIPPKESFQSTYKAPSQTYEHPNKEYTVPMKDDPVKEYLPPDKITPVLVNLKPNTLISKEHHDSIQPPPPQIHIPLDMGMLPPDKEYVLPSSYTLPLSTPGSSNVHKSSDVSHLPGKKYKTSTEGGASPEQTYESPKSDNSRNGTTTYPPVYILPTKSEPGYDVVTTGDPSTTHPPRRPQVIFVDDYDYYYGYDDYDNDYYDDVDEYYYYDDDDDDYYYYDDDYDYDYDDYAYGIISTHQRTFMPHILMSDLDDIIHDVDIMEYGYILGIPGIAGRDYPILQYIPLTTFRCHLVADYPGYYADMEAGCQVFHVCHRNGRQDSFLCPNGTIFNQKYFVCDWWYNFSCEDAVFFYPVNAAIEYQEVPLHENVFNDETKALPTSAGRYRKSPAGPRNRRKTSFKRGKPGRRRLRRRYSKRRGQPRFKKYQ